MRGGEGDGGDHFAVCVVELVLLGLHEAVEKAVEGAVAVQVADEKGVARLVDYAQRGD